LFVIRNYLSFVLSIFYLFLFKEKDSKKKFGLDYLLFYFLKKKIKDKIMSCIFIMNISDYIPNYIELNNPMFNEKIQYKKEFYDLRTSNKSEKLKGKLWKHQELLSRFVSPYTDYNEQLLFHTPGTGKTCGAVAIVEVHKLDPLVRKPILVIVPNDTLVNQWKQQISTVCTDGDYIPENYYSTEPGEKLTSGEKTARINKLISPIYHITTIEKMRRLIDKLPDKILQKKFSNTIIIIDEAHNLRIETHGSKENLDASKNRYNSFHRFLHVVENSKKLLLTGTPMYDRISELPGLLNLILPMDSQLPTGGSFTKKYLIKKSGVRSISKEDELMSYLVGRVSYIREGGDFPKRIDIGETKWTQFIKTQTTQISDLHLKGYLECYEADTSQPGQLSTGLWKNSRQGATFMYKLGNNYIWGAKAFKELTIKGKPKKIKIEDREMVYTPISINPKYKDDLKKNIAEYSAKYNYIINFVNEHPNEPIFIFTPLVSGTGGAIFLGLILELFGYTKALGASLNPTKRYALITGEDKSALQRKKLIEIYNSAENSDGKLIHIMIASKTISEGTSFTNVKHEFVVSPYWNNSGTEQAISRGLRANSLTHLSPELREVTVQQLSIDHPKLELDKNIDAGLYVMSETKDFEIKNAERLLKKVAWDCSLNYERNMRESEVDFSRNCDYQKCNYVCYQTNPIVKTQKYDYGLDSDKLDKSTFYLYYSESEIMRLTEKIRGVFLKYNYIDINGLNNLIKLNDFKLLVLTIEYIIENNIIFYNKWGYPCFMRKQGNILFLSFSPTENDILDSWYINNPFVNNNIPLTNVVNDEIYSIDMLKLDKLNLNNYSQAVKIIDDLFLETKIFMLEYLLSLNPIEMDDKQKGMYNIFLKIFKNHVFKINDILIHDLSKLKMANDYVDFSAGENGSLRCFKSGVWDDCDRRQEEEMSKVIKEYKQEWSKEIIENKYNIYGIIETDGKFKIADKTKETGVAKSDARSQFRGKVCVAGWQKWEIISLYIRLKINIPVEIDKTFTKKDLLFEALSRFPLDKLLDEFGYKRNNIDLEFLQKIYTLNKMDIKTLCKSVQDWFEENKLMIYEK